MFASFSFLKWYEPRAVTLETNNLSFTCWRFLKQQHRFLQISLQDRSGKPKEVMTCQKLSRYYYNQKRINVSLASFLELLVILQLNTFPHFPKNARRKCQTTDPAKTHSNLSVPSDKSQSEPRYRGCGVTISIWCWARVILGSGRLITNTVNCSKLEWVGDTFASSHNKAVFTLPRV